jgi:hypothetical protein
VEVVVSSLQADHIVDVGCSLSNQFLLFKLSDVPIDVIKLVAIDVVDGISFFLWTANIYRQLDSGVLAEPELVAFAQADAELVGYRLAASAADYRALQRPRPAPSRADALVWLLERLHEVPALAVVVVDCPANSQL